MWLTMPSPDGIAFVISKDERVGTLHYFPCENEVGFASLGSRILPLQGGRHIDFSGSDLFGFCRGRSETTQKYNHGRVKNATRPAGGPGSFSAESGRFQGNHQDAPNRRNQANDQERFGNQNM